MKVITCNIWKQLKVKLRRQYANYVRTIFEMPTHKLMLILRITLHRLANRLTSISANNNNHNHHHNNNNHHHNNNNNSPASKSVLAKVSLPEVNDEDQTQVPVT